MAALIKVIIIFITNITTIDPILIFLTFFTNNFIFLCLFLIIKLI